MPVDPRLKAPCPATSNGSAWSAFEFIVDLVLADPTNRTRLSNSQRDLLAFFELRQAINSGGLDSYFRYHGEDGDRVAAAALAIAGPNLHQFCSDAVALLGSSYPEDPSERESRLEPMEDQLDDLDRRYYELEAEETVDDDADTWVWERRADFFGDSPA